MSPSLAFALGMVLASVPWYFMVCAAVAAERKKMHVVKLAIRLSHIAMLLNAVVWLYLLVHP